MLLSLEAANKVMKVFGGYRDVSVQIEHQMKVRTPHQHICEQGVVGQLFCMVTELAGILFE
jgi:hypothetical protein